MVTQLCGDIEIPKMAVVNQIFDKSCIAAEDIPGIVKAGLLKGSIKGKIEPGMSVAITAGSRGVANVALVTKAIVDFVKECGAEPFVFPAMGSHGGATVPGQLEILESYGITEEYVGCPIKASMETVMLGHTETGMPVFMDKYAHEADAVILSGRIKAHTAFRGPYESGLLKMSVIGMGKQHGAETVHQVGFEPLGELLPKIARVVFDNSNIIAGVGLIENAYDKTCEIAVLDTEEIWDEEPGYLIKSKERLGKILFNDIDLLIVDKLGKDISGDGMDPNVTGRFAVAKANDGSFRVQRIAVLDLTDDTHGNANGIGMADVTTNRLAGKVNLDITYPNAVTSTVMSVVKIPFITESDKVAIQMGISCLNNADRKNLRIVRIKDTLSLGEIMISEALMEEAKNNPGIEIVKEPEALSFNADGNLW